VVRRLPTGEARSALVAPEQDDRRRTAFLEQEGRQAERRAAAATGTALPNWGGPQLRSYRQEIQARGLEIAPLVNFVAAYAPTAVESNPRELALAGAPEPAAL